MKKGLVALLMAGMLGCAPSVVAKKPPTLKQLYKNAYVIRAELVAEKRGENDIGFQSHGTAFIAKTALQSLLATNRHVIDFPRVPEGYTPKHITYSIVDNEDDDNQYDDLFLTLVATSDDDLALLMYDGMLPARKVPYCEPSVGAVSYMVGFPFADIKVLDEGIVSNAELNRTGQRYFVSSNDALPGMSGSPDYTRNAEGLLCLYGITLGMTKQSGYSLSVPSSRLEDLLKRYAKSHSKADKQLKKDHPVIYEYQGLPDIESEKSLLDDYKVESDPGYFNPGFF